jgi:hypothetical protein
MDESERGSAIAFNPSAADQNSAAGSISSVLQSMIKPPNWLLCISDISQVDFRQATALPGKTQLDPSFTHKPFTWYCGRSGAISAPSEELRNDKKNQIDPDYTGVGLGCHVRSH